MATSSGINRGNSNFYHNTHQQHLLHKQGSGAPNGVYPNSGTQTMHGTHTTTLPGINPQTSLQGGHIPERHLSNHNSNDVNKRRPSSFNEF